jgi:hypothetical protein
MKAVSSKSMKITVKEFSFKSVDSKEHKCSTVGDCVFTMFIMKSEHSIGSVLTTAFGPAENPSIIRAD